MARFIQRDRRVLRYAGALVAFAALSILPAALIVGPAAATPPPNGCVSPTYVPVSCALTLSSAVDPRGSTVTIGGSGFKPDSHVTLFLRFTYLGSAETDSSGDFSVSEVVPYYAPLGGSFIRAEGTNELGGSLTLYAHVFVTPPVPTKTTTTTQVYESHSSATFGNEDSVAFTVVVTPTHGPSNGLSGEAVTVNVGSASCVATLFHGAGNCDIGSAALPEGGPYAVSATFAGTSEFEGSSSTNTVNFTVTGKPGTTMMVGESRPFGTYGQENRVGFTADVATDHGGFGRNGFSLNGDAVTIDIGTASCVATLFRGTGTCAIGATDLPVGGPYAVTASFAGDPSFGASTSTNAVNFTVGKGSQSIYLGSLSDQKLSQSPVTVSANASSGLPVTFTTTTPSVCTSGGTDGSAITLVQTGTCTVVASQSGGSTFNSASPVDQSFEVLRNLAPPPPPHHHHSH